MKRPQLRFLVKVARVHWRTRRATAPNLALRGRHRDRPRCFVLGNGPSLKQQDLRPLKNEIVLVCNFFNLHPLCAEIAPRYFSFADPEAFFPGTCHEALEVKRAEWFRDICEKVPQAEFFVPAGAKPAIERAGFFAGHPVWYVATSDASTRCGWAGSELTRPIPAALGTVTMLSIPAALYMGFRTIYLLGCDCNWWLDNLVRGEWGAEHQHFYGRNPFVERESSLCDFGLESEFKSLSEHLASYRLLRQHAEGLGARIINATGGGILDVFERAKLEELFVP
jgi:hypothetical protein